MKNSAGLSLLTVNIRCLFPEVNDLFYACELYDIEKDTSETSNLVKKYPRRVKIMAGNCHNEALRTEAKPWLQKRLN